MLFVVKLINEHFKQTTCNIKVSVLNVKNMSCTPHNTINFLTVLLVLFPDRATAQLDRHP